MILAEHLPGDAPVMDRVSDFEQALAELGTRGLLPETRVELPLEPWATFRSPGGQRLGLYQDCSPLAARCRGQDHRSNDRS